MGSIEFLEKNRTFPLSLNEINVDSQKIFYTYINNSYDETFQDLFIKYSSENLTHIKFEPIESFGDFFDNRLLYLNKLYETQKNIKEKNYAYYIIEKMDKDNHNYLFN